jgi:hypothetical protein
MRLQRIVDDDRIRQLEVNLEGRGRFREHADSFSEIEAAALAKTTDDVADVAEQKPRNRMRLTDPIGGRT